MVNESEVEALLAPLEPLHTVVEDMSDGCGAKFDIFIVSDRFAGKRVLERHRMVNDALKEVMETIHAVTIKALTNDQWEKEKEKE
ncbi:hypothetical protein PMAYCL1PPCAC_14722 [Pristionchus mayeri]|uniref:Uncharacterized protein n=1 Tax=Pristionchus mayeri TaxID=1317129 RepID=A0AAN5CHK0_9BILA|nr:hypothetical protein PMAYCL1PPCAC_14722 [Pristionchus mayeri]